MDSVLAVYQERMGQFGELERRVDREAVERVEEFSRMRAGLEG
jgi:predicted nuclease with TOPRIM domain